MTQFFHAHKVIPEKCNGHMACMRQCPTQAIRIRNGKSVYSEELCVDCGTCLSICPEKAIVPISDSVYEFNNYKYKVVVPSPVLYSQFDSNTHPYIIHLALKELGFDEIVDVSTSTAVLAKFILKYMKGYKGEFPLISSNCPSLIRLIQVKYPDLVDHVIPIDVPREVTAREIRENHPAKLGLKAEEIGITYIAPCPAKIVSIKQPAEKAKSWFDNVISIKDIYSLLLPHVKDMKVKFKESQVPESFSFNAGWVTLGNLTRSAKVVNWLAVSGLDHVRKILDDIENSRLRNIDFVEAYTCMLGCIGGPFNVENPYVARANSITQRQKYEKHIKIDDKEIEKKIKDGYYYLEKPIAPRPTKYFDSDLATSLKKMKERETVYKNLKQIDCGCCGAPTCLAFAEDFVRKEVKLTDCIFLSESNVEREPGPGQILLNNT